MTAKYRVRPTDVKATRKIMLLGIITLLPVLDCILLIQLLLPNKASTIKIMFEASIPKNAMRENISIYQGILKRPIVHFEEATRKRGITEDGRSIANII